MGAIRVRVRAADLAMHFDSPSLTVALALVAGVCAQAIARHIRLPGIVLLLAVGVLLGPDMANLVRPHTLGSALPELVGFAVAVILFEGGLNLNLKSLRRQAKPIRRLVSYGALITAVGGALVAWLVMGWGWTTSVLFGTLVIVTGPTVITPLVRRIRVKARLASVLEAEGIFIDAVGATIAVVALEVVLHPSPQSLGMGVLEIAAILGVGACVGLVSGGLLGLLLRWRKVVPDGLENILALGVAVSTYQVANALVEESGIAAAIMAGMVAGNVRSQVLEELKEFKEQLTVMFIATLFVLLAADVRIADVRDLGWRGVLTVAALMFLVRPLQVWIATRGTDLSRREKHFLAWLAPRGIVAAAVASLVAQQLASAGIAGGVELRALVFLVIAITVTVQGLTGGLVASFLKVRQERGGYVFLGANCLARYLATSLKKAGHEVVLLDTSPDHCRAAEAVGLRVLFGNGLDENMLLKARADNRLGCVALTPNEEVNFLFAGRVLDSFRGPEVYVALESFVDGVTEKMVVDRHAHVLFGAEQDIELWATRLRRGVISFERWSWPAVGTEKPATIRQAPSNLLLPLLGYRGELPLLVSDQYVGKKGDVLEIAILTEMRAEAAAWLEQAGWRHLPGRPEAATALYGAGEEPAVGGDGADDADGGPSPLDGEVDAEVANRPAPA